MSRDKLASKWWLPLVVLFSPGVCYAYSAFIPFFRMDFAMLGILLTLILFFLMTWVVFNPTAKGHQIVQMIFLNGVFFSLMLISLRYWFAWFEELELIILLIFLVVYILVINISRIAPRFVRRFVNDVNAPKSLFMRTMAAISLTFGGAAGASGYFLGRALAEQPDSVAIPVFAVTTLSVLVFGLMYASYFIWDHQIHSSIQGN